MAVVAQTDGWIFTGNSHNYTLSDEEYEAACNHTYGMDSSAKYYATNRKTKEEKAKLDILRGKCGEFIAKDFLLKFDGTDYQPDLEIYKSKEKSFSTDLGKLFHVKSNHWELPKTSWTFQYKNKYGNYGQDDIFKKTSDDLANEIGLFVKLDESGRSGCVMLMASMDIVRQYLRDPIVPFLIGIKKCLYVSDFID